ncbi:MAG: hypothetical protein AAF518_06425 [Spirochaetota bacterium]
MFEILKEKIRDNFLTVLFATLFSLVAIVAIVSFSIIKVGEPSAVKSMQECFTICEKSVESFSIDPKHGKPVCKCKTGLLQRALEKYIED